MVASDTHLARPSTPLAIDRHRRGVLMVMKAQKRAQPEVRQMSFEELWDKDIGELARLYTEARAVIDSGRLMTIFGVMR